MTDQPTTLTTVTAYFTERSTAALDRAAATTGDTRTDTINRAVQLYDQLVDAVQSGGRILISMPDGVERVDVPPADEPTVCTCDQFAGHHAPTCRTITGKAS